MLFMNFGSVISISAYALVSANAEIALSHIPDTSRGERNFPQFPCPPSTIVKSCAMM